MPIVVGSALHGALRAPQRPKSETNARIAPSSRAIRERNNPVKSRGEGSVKQQRCSALAFPVLPDGARTGPGPRTTSIRRPRIRIAEIEVLREAAGIIGYPSEAEPRLRPLERSGSRTVTQLTLPAGTPGP